MLQLWQSWTFFFQMSSSKVKESDDEEEPTYKENNKKELWILNRNKENYFSSTSYPSPVTMLTISSTI